jgi:cytochrome c peroxidase/soluble cytochrome b562
MAGKRNPFGTALAVLAASAALAGTAIAEFGGNASVLPAGTELGEEAFDKPREVFRSESGGGHKSYLVILGDVAFSSPLTLGGTARQAGISCNTCHINGSTNPRLYVPGLSTQSGTFDTTGHLFNPKADNGVLDPLTIPSLRGAHLLAPYGHDGRTLSLTDFARNVIVNEFAGPEPSPEILDAIVAYIEDIDFVPNRRLGAAGKLTGPLSDSEKHGEALFYKPFAHDPTLSCAGCHVPSGTFVDHRQHDVGSGGLFKTPTLLNANFNAPYFHDGRYLSYAQVVGHFDRTFYLGLSARDRQDLVAYLQAIGDAEQALLPDNVETRIREISDFMSVLDTAVPEHNAAIATMTLDTIDRELRDLTEQFPERKNSIVADGVEERRDARSALKYLVLSLHQINSAMRNGRFDAAAAALVRSREMLSAAVPVLQASEPWSLFNRQVHDAHFAAVRRLYRSAIDPALAPRRRYDPD